MHRVSDPCRRDRLFLRDKFVAGKGMDNNQHPVAAVLRSRPRLHWRPWSSISGLLRGYSMPSHVLGRDSPGTNENSGHDHTKEESTDVGEERDTTATAVRGVNQRGVALEELVQEPAAEEEPCRDPDREPRHERKDA